MERMAFRKIFLPGVIFLSLALVLGQPAWGCDDNKDKDGCDHHHHQCYPPLVIQSVNVDLQSNKIVIHGENFDNGDFPVVTLGGTIELEVEPNYTGSEIVAKLSEDNLNEIKDSDYRLVVSTGHGKKCKDKYSLTIGAPAGAGPQVAIESIIVPSPSGSGDIFEGTANCASGYVVTGGGFEGPQSGITITKSYPTKQTVTNSNGQPVDVDAWKVSGTVIFPAEAAAITIYAICVRLVSSP